jgi:hypothetical protein
MLYTMWKEVVVACFNILSQLDENQVWEHEPRVHSSQPTAGCYLLGTDNVMRCLLTHTLITLIFDQLNFQVSGWHFPTVTS